MAKPVVTRCAVKSCSATVEQHESWSHKLDHLENAGYAFYCCSVCKIVVGTESAGRVHFYDEHLTPRPSPISLCPEERSVACPAPACDIRTQDENSIKDHYVQSHVRDTLVVKRPPIGFFKTAWNSLANRNQVDQPQNLLHVKHPKLDHETPSSPSHPAESQTILASPKIPPATPSRYLKTGHGFGQKGKVPIKLRLNSDTTQEPKRSYEGLASCPAHPGIISKPDPPGTLSVEDSKKCVMSLLDSKRSYISEYESQLRISS